MQNLLIFLVILLVTAGLTFAMGEPPEKVKIIDKNIEVINLKIEGMTCLGCVPTVKSALLKVPEVKEAEVSLSKGEAKVYTEKGKVNPADLIKAVEKAGYKAILIKEERVR